MTYIMFQLGYLIVLPYWFNVVAGALRASEDSSRISISNDRLSFAVTKSSGSVSSLSLDGQNLLGSGRGPYLDCHCVPSGFWTPGSGATYKLFQGVDQDGKAYGGAMMSHNYQNTGKVLEQYWFLRDGETGLHMFSRASYRSSSNPNGGGDIGELRTLFRPSGAIWSHLSSTNDMYAPLPDTSGAPSVQDASWYVGAKTSSPYVQQMSDYFTKYMFSESWRDQTVHGMFSDGKRSNDGSTFGAWLVMNTKETYFGGPTHSDLTVDGIVYNYLVSNHHGNGVPAFKNGFDRTFGPQYYYFNKGSRTSTIQELRADAAKYGNSEWAASFYDSIAKHVPNLVPSNGRGTWNGQIALPSGATNALAILSKSGLDYQDNNEDGTAYQYWGDINSAGAVRIPRVKAGTYRLTVYADGIFGQYTQDNIRIDSGSVINTAATWTPESAGVELWRVGTPDRSSGEFRHGNAKDTSHPRQPNEYRLYWAVHDFPNDFPNGVNFKIGQDDISRGLNYVHWSVFGGKGNSIRKTPYYTNVNTWTLTFDTTADKLAGKSQATLTIQLAGVKTSAGNTDSAGNAFATLPYTVSINGRQLPTWNIPPKVSSSCAVRSAAQCYQTGHKFVFDASFLKSGTNTLLLSLPPRATAPESAVLPESVYLQYDALRLEVK